MQVKTTISSIWSGLVYMGGVILFVYKKVTQALRYALDFALDNWWWMLILFSMLLTFKAIFGNMEEREAEKQIRAQVLETERGCAMSCLPYVSKRIEVLGEIKCYCYTNAGTFEPNE